MSGISPQQKKDPIKKRKRQKGRKMGVRIEKQKRWNLIWRSSMIQKKKKMMKFTSYRERFSKERK
jgi:hypothetical protein